MSVFLIQTGVGGSAASGANQQWVIITTTSGLTAAASQSIYVDTTAGPVTILLPLASATLGYSIRVKKVTADVNAVTVGVSGSDAIDTEASWNLGLLNSGVEVTAASSGNWRTA
jgi:hypothetical protein